MLAEVLRSVSETEGLLPEKEKDFQENPVFQVYRALFLIWKVGFPSSGEGPPWAGGKVRSVSMERPCIFLPGRRARPRGEVWLVRPLGQRTEL